MKAEFTATCTDCGRELSIIAGSAGWAAKRFKRVGWANYSLGKWRCTTCSATKRKSEEGTSHV